MNVLIRISFLGENYYGTQKQAKNRTIQGEFEKYLSRIYSTEIKVTICSRLDRKVNALDFALSFFTDNESISLDHLKYYLARSLDNDIFIKEVKRVADDFSPRYNCINKQYLYQIQNGNEYNPLLKNFTYIPPMPLDKEIIKEVVYLYKGKHDFRYFSTPEGDENTILNIDDVLFSEEDDILKIRFIGKSFLRYQIRFMVGSAIAVCNKKLTIDNIKDRLNSIDSAKSKYKAEPQGLLLEKINY